MADPRAPSAAHNPCVLTRNSDQINYFKHFCPTSHVLCRISAHFNFFTKLKESCFVSFTKGRSLLWQCIAWTYTQETKPANTRQQEQFVIAINS